MEIGEPDFPTPAPVVAAAQTHIASGRTFYPRAGAAGTEADIADFYRGRYGVAVPASRIVVTAGASAALLLAMACLCEPEQRMAADRPGLPLQQQFRVRSFEGPWLWLSGQMQKQVQPTTADVRHCWNKRAAGALFASPANPTGTLMDDRVLESIAEFVRRHQGTLIVDEIYHGLTLRARRMSRTQVRR